MSERARKEGGEERGRRMWGGKKAREREGKGRENEDEEISDGGGR